ncbi:F-box/LRR-repeat protein 4 [Sitophilus oryzae]|uniref:F-box/LRR-repeat protein 4 n=1 Tax=Sitophilus oryzae TaxID=7048 RepID=A0A6J2XWG5_SITOR|nr:F-box/LRR-repeat protein 4 [Sitophilus oryzae]XP_030755830.1 F-box/LRR-repeat protein 4 [Sitophilus oryzae]XP_030755837.1 F-box/LRR-repeat protein 4 [Sitophilus oryzae]XP_030755846.1 F-box/LRR-repeat protein 4 [Sitophilus oryzae]XP_030755855.1 F-box/LRR-repeat protein 4 [Sitophilus oryzae]XP_030755863.1 F-box/LRR-repeat protein 4 [Sitophilus oryzae]XP_030755872.1 F-box/LRR-repeat protein 4 [Sitophilus oryzae]XP_030755881.1 F-box/LRR-repeat protein 4 [Sitophilus oryzae]XP_030755888.1 F-bo
MNYLEQYVNDVWAYSSRYNNIGSYSYAPINLIGKYERYPAYGDFPETYFLRTYGKWWKQSGSSQKCYRFQDCDKLVEDFVIVGFGCAVIPTDICIYEIYNPGAIIRIWGAWTVDKKWHLLWEDHPQKCDPVSRKFCPSLRKLNCLVNLIRIEFNSSYLEYHTAIDAILLGGYQPETNLQTQLANKGLLLLQPSSNDTPNVTEKEDSLQINDKDYFSSLPNEIILKIFQYLDLKSLSRCAQINKRWNTLCQDQTLYQCISLKIYWHLVDTKAIEYFRKKNINVKKLDLSWCDQGQVYGQHILNSEYYIQLRNFLDEIKHTVTHISLNDNYFVDNNIMNVISSCHDLVELRLHNTLNWHRAPLYFSTKLVTLDLSCTHVQDLDLIKILQSTINLEHLILDLCEGIYRMDLVLRVAIEHNRKLKTWSSWKTTSFSLESIKLFGQFLDLEELDLGWCFITNDPADCLSEIARCRKLKRLVLSSWRSVSDEILLPIILSCKELVQIDLMGIKGITSEICERALYMLPKLRLLDISFCDDVRQDEVEIWRQQYPHIKIQRSCQYTSRPTLFH